MLDWRGMYVESCDDANVGRTASRLSSVQEAGDA